jgi:hypothetical protein
VIVSLNSCIKSFTRAEPRRDQVAPAASRCSPRSAAPSRVRINGAKQKPRPRAEGDRGIGRGWFPGNFGKWFSLIRTDRGVIVVCVTAAHALKLIHSLSTGPRQQRCYTKKPQHGRPGPSTQYQVRSTWKSWRAALKPPTRGQHNRNTQSYSRLIYAKSMLISRHYVA